jgi:hypothetical protein
MFLEQVDWAAGEVYLVICAAQASRPNKYGGYHACVSGVLQYANAGSTVLPSQPNQSFNNIAASNHDIGILDCYAQETNVCPHDFSYSLLSRAISSIRTPTGVSLDEHFSDPNASQLHGKLRRTAE